MKALILTLSLLLSQGSVWASDKTAASETASASQTANLENGVILKGYDPVSYFNAKGPAKGVSHIKTQVDGITYLFASEDNKKEFLKDPKKYAPAYEGWCATAVVKNIKYDIDPTNFKITDGRLFLFYRESGLFGGDAKPDWVKNEPESIKKADNNWPQVRISKK
ncbi:MAG: YHS domain-containing (seleno)protein [Pseudobdellovibrionaceae bacterium]